MSDPSRNELLLDNSVGAKLVMDIGRLYVKANRGQRAGMSYWTGYEVLVDYELGLWMVFDNFTQRHRRGHFPSLHELESTKWQHAVIMIQSSRGTIQFDQISTPVMDEILLRQAVEDIVPKGRLDNSDFSNLCAKWGRELHWDIAVPLMGLTAANEYHGLDMVIVLFRAFDPARQDLLEKLEKIDRCCRQVKRVGFTDPLSQHFELLFSLGQLVILSICELHSQLTEGVIGLTIIKGLLSTISDWVEAKVSDHKQLPILLSRLANDVDALCGETQNIQECIRKLDDHNVKLNSIDKGIGGLGKKLDNHQLQLEDVGDFSQKLDGQKLQLGEHARQIEGSIRAEITSSRQSIE
ncbi:hypothetical protein CHU98_g3809 [Xylaria longipes]|nr:hypothetical protein CHU98_g3809 [Xylaria longipes]